MAPDLAPELYEELRRLSRKIQLRELTSERKGPTDVLHDALVRCLRYDEGILQQANVREIAARAMRRVLIDDYRERHRQKRSGAWHRISLSRHLEAMEMPSMDFEALEEGLDLLEKSYPLHARVVQMRFYGCYSERETAEALNVSPRTVHNYWSFARAWLRKHLGRERGDERSG